MNDPMESIHDHGPANHRERENWDLRLSPGIEPCNANPRCVEVNG